MKENGFEYVDLGLPSKTMWATWNVGADKPEDNGLLFQFGRVDGYRYGDINNKFRTIDQNKQDTGSEEIPVTSSGKIYKENEILDLADDAAHVHMGGVWKMPTGSYQYNEQYEGDWGELLNNTTHEVETINNVKGMLFTSNINGHQLFIPFMQGYGWNGNWEDWCRSFAFMWSSQVLDFNVDSAYKLYCNSSGDVDIDYDNRSSAFSVRGVFKKSTFQHILEN